MPPSPKHGNFNTSLQCFKYGANLTCVSACRLTLAARNYELFPVGSYNFYTKWLWVCHFPSLSLLPHLWNLQNKSCLAYLTRLLWGSYEIIPYVKCYWICHSPMSSIAANVTTISTLPVTCAQGLLSGSLSSEWMHTIIIPGVHSGEGWKESSSPI